MTTLGMTNRLAWLTLVAAAFSGACASPVITKRYAVLNPAPPAVASNAVTVSGSAFPIETAGPKLLFDLSGGDRRR